MATTVNIRATASGELIRAWVDGSVVALSGGTGSKNLAPGDHVISWVVRGAPGTPYTVQITAPASIAFKKEAKLDSTQIDAGMHWFTL